MKNVFAVTVTARELKAPTVIYKKVVHLDADSAAQAKDICRTTAAMQDVNIIKISARKVF